VAAALSRRRASVYDGRMSSRGRGALLTLALAAAAQPAAAQQPAAASAPQDPVVVVAPPPTATGPEARGAGTAVVVAPLPVDAPPPPDAPPPAADDLIIPPYAPINLSFIHPLATNPDTPHLWTHLDLAVLVGRVGFVDGLQIGLGTWTGYQLRGVQIGLATVVSGRAYGAQIAGAFNYMGGPLRGLQFGGVLGLADESIAGAQVAGIGNQIFGDLDGVQIAGVVNIARRLVTGVQVAGAVNVGRVDGVQIGPINVSQEQRGLQMGVINVARRITGLQIGVINITDELDGKSLGVIPLPRRGGIHPTFWLSSSLIGNAGVKLTSRHAYTILSGSIHGEEAPGGGLESLVAAGLTMGARLPFEHEGITTSADLGAFRAFRGEFTLSGRDEIYKIRALVAYSIVPRMSPYLGVGLHAKVRGGEDEGEGEGEGEVSVRFGPEIVAGLEL